MIELPFGTEALREIIAFRNELANHFFQFLSYMGEVEGYILIITFIYTVLDKDLAYRLSILTLISMSGNHLLKSIIGMERPFVKEGTFLENWLVSPENANELASENSTPSGHAMSSSTFYGYLWMKTKKRYVRYGMVLLIILVGVSRPYLAVHYIEDILLGWIFGICLLLIVYKYMSNTRRFWNKLTLVKQLFLVIGGSLVLWIVTFYINGGYIENQPLPFVGYLGFLLGVCLGYKMEEQHVQFNPRSKKWPIKLLRWIMTVILVMIPVIILDEIFESKWEEPTLYSHLIQYLGYTISGFLGIFIAPYFFLKLNMVDAISTK